MNPEIADKFESLFGRQVHTPTREQFAWVAIVNTLMQAVVATYEETALTNGRNIKIYFAFLDVATGTLWRASIIRSPEGGESYYIGLNARFLDSVFLVFNRILAQQDFLPALFDRHLIQGIFPKLPDLNADRLAFAEELLVPTDPLRQKLASFLATIACKLMVIHELSHAGWQHFHFRERASICNLFGEDRFDHERILTLRAMEVEADRQAVLNCVQQALNSPLLQRTDSKFAAENLDTKRFRDLVFLDRETVICWVSVAVRVLMAFPDTAQSSKEHPPTRLRLLLMYRQLLRAYWLKSNEFQQRFRYEPLRDTIIAYGNRALDLLVENAEQLKVSDLYTDAIRSDERQLLDRAAELLSRSTLAKSTVQPSTLNFGYGLDAKGAADQLVKLEKMRHEISGWFK